MQAVAPPVLYVPAGHATLVAGVVQYLPAGHKEQDAEPGWLYSVELHGVQAVAPAGL